MFDERRLPKIKKEIEQQSEIPPTIKDTLRAHIVDMEPTQIGRKELIKQMANAPVGAMDVVVPRPEPSLRVESAVLMRGKSKVLIGPNGAGKSTFFDAIMERDAHFDTKKGRGAVVFGRPVHIRDRIRISRLDQEELLGRINEYTALEVLSQAERYFKAQFPVNWDNQNAYESNIDNQAAHTRIETLMNQIATLFDMDGFLETKVKYLSGGERTKLALFMVLLSEPDVLLLDEPTNHLDLKSIAKLTSLFDEYKKVGLAIVSVSHVDWFLRDAGADGVLEIVWNAGDRTLRDSGASYERYVQNPTRERVPIIRGDIEWPQQEYGYRYGELVVNTPPTFSIKDSPLQGVSMPSIIGGELVFLLGDNGTGKTKLLETIVHSERSDLPQKQQGVHIAYLPQFWPEEVVRGTVGDFFQWVQNTTDPYMKGSAAHPEQPAQNLFIKLAKQVAFGGSAKIGEAWLKRPFSKLSSGEQRLLWFLAASSLRNVDILALDEPTNHMDRILQEKVARAIRSFPGTVIIATHDRNLIAALAHDGGTIRGSKRHPTPIVLERIGQKTRVTLSTENPMTYVERIMREARQKAKKLKT